MTQHLHTSMKLLASAAMLLTTAFANAADFEPTPTTFTTNTISGAYEVLLSGLQQDNLAAGMDESLKAGALKLVDANGQTVNLSQVLTSMKDDYTVTFIVDCPEAPAEGTYKIQVPAAAFYLAMMPHITSDAFELTINYTASPVVDPSDPDPGVDPVDPIDHGNTAIFTLNDYKSDMSIYYMTGDVIQSDKEGVKLTFDRVAMETSKYSYTYKSNAGFTQFKDCDFTITAPEGRDITQIEFIDAVESNIYGIEYIEAPGCVDGLWTGCQPSVSFKTAVFQTPIYDYVYDDYDEDNYYEVISGYYSEAKGARVAQIIVTLKSDNQSDAISTVSSDNNAAVAFDLAGRRISAPRQGLMVIGGKKVVIR